jgi:HrpA-like RNA helicase
MRTAECKDCAREVRAGKRDEGTQFFQYPESWALGQLDRGGSRTDRCREHREKHRLNTAGLTVAYIDLETVGEVADRQNPSGPLGGLGPLPDVHEFADSTGVDLGQFGFGMDEGHIRGMLDSLADPERRVLIVKAGTGTGKSTYMPYRLLDPPDGCFRLADLGPIIVTEPRVQATVGVADFVGRVMSGAEGVGPGYPVGYQVSGDRQHDPACQLVYVTDGTMINWLREGRLSQIGTVIVDEAHERSANIDFILGYLKRELPRYPHLRVIVTSATFNADFYQQFFGGEAVAGKIDVPAVKTIGYGWPLFPELDTVPPGEPALRERWEALLPDLPLAEMLDEERLVLTAWPRKADPLKDDEVSDPADAGYEEDLHETTRRLLPLRFQDPLPTHQWKTKMPETLGRFVTKLAKGLDRAGIYGDILGFLPTTKSIEEACEIVRAGIGDHADVYALISSLPAEEKALALEARKMGDRRKIVISTNLAETSLTVEGVRFVVDSGLIAQSEWNPAVAQGGIRTKPHSQAGIRQRWGRVGRKAPGWVFPLYTKAQLVELAEDTDPGSTRDNLEQMVMTAKLGGIDDVLDFPWPAAFEPEPPVALDEKALDAQKKFKAELGRANVALRSGGAVDERGHPTSFGKELSRFSALGSSACAVAIMYADRLGCVPEVATILSLLHERALTGPRGLLLDSPDWPDEWRFEAAERHRALGGGCEDDAELVLQIAAGWERADREQPPWEPSPARTAWARKWWVGDEVLREAAEVRRDILAALSPAMKEEVKRFVEPALLRRARGAITHAMPDLEHRRMEADSYRAVDAAEDEEGLAALEDSSVLIARPERAIPLTRRHPTGQDTARISNLVTAEPWAVPDPAAEMRPTGPDDAMWLLGLSAEHGRVDATKDTLGAMIEAWPAGGRVRPTFSGTADKRIVEVTGWLEPSLAPAAAEEVDGTVVDDVEGEETGTLEDAAPEDDTSWPTPNEEEKDPELQARIEVLDSREIEAAQAACAVCPRCLAGEPEHCESPLQLDDGVATDVLARWRERASLGIDVSTPNVEIVDGEPVDGEWYEVVSYRVSSAGEPAVMLRPDWRAGRDDTGPAEHPDLEPGADVEVIVGPLVSDHRDPLRILNRADGKGRFLLREAPISIQRQEEHEQLACSLVRQHQGLLRRLKEGATLTVTAIPRDEPDCYTVTLLELLRGHLERGNDGVAEWLSISAGGDREIKVPFYPATIASEPNRNGYVEIELLVRDEEKGIVHGAAFLSGESNGVEAPTPGAAVLLPLRRDNASLPLQGVELERVREIAGDERVVRLSLGDEDDEDGAEEEDESADLGSVDAKLTSGRPVPKEIAERLAELNPDPIWVSSVWRFWCRSRHLRTDRQEPYRPGTRSEPVQFVADVTLEQPTGPGPTLADIESVYAPGLVTQATVTRVLQDGSRAWLSLPDGAEATVVRQAVGSGGVLTLASVLAPEMELAVEVVGARLHRDKPQVQVSVPGIEIPPLTEQLAALGVVPGRRLSGPIKNVNPTLGLFIEVAPKINGLAHVSGLPGRSVDGFEIDAMLDVEILKVGENPRKPGSPNIGLQLLTGS